MSFLEVKEEARKVGFVVHVVASRGDHMVGCASSCLLSDFTMPHRWNAACIGRTVGAHEHDYVVKV
jgi:hypothetical protein